MPKKPKTLGEQLFDIAEAEACKRQSTRQKQRWLTLPSDLQARYETIAERFQKLLAEEASRA